MMKNKTIMTIHSMEDLVELVNHNNDIFYRKIKKLMKNNRSLEALCVLAIGCTIYAVIENRRQEERIYQLSIRVEKLENSEGE